MLNQTNIFVDFTTISSTATESSVPSRSLWNFLWQVILAKELAGQPNRCPDASMIGFTNQVLASVIVWDL